MYKRVSQHPGYKRLCEKQGASLLLTVGLVYTCDLAWLQKLYYFKHYITDIYFQCLVDAHSGNPRGT